MLRNRVLQLLSLVPKMHSVSIMLVLLSTSPALAQVVDLPSTELERTGKAVSTAGARITDEPAHEHSVRHVQAQVPQGQVPQGQVPQGQVPSTQALQAPAVPVAPPLNFDPDASINQLLPPQPPPAGNLPPQNVTPRRGASAGAVRNSFSAAPTMMGDFFGGGFSNLIGSQTESFSEHSAGTILSGLGGDANATLVFEFGGDVVPNDVFTTGTGIDASGDGFADRFSILEPLPPNGALTSPGLNFVFDGGTATYTQTMANDTPVNGAFASGEQWLVEYSYTSTIGDPTGTIRPVPGPGVSARRVKISENFSPDVRDRFFANYSFFNDSFGGLGDISRYVLGVERVLVDDLISMEFRLPMAGTYASSQDLDRSESRDFEFGNATIIAKGILLRTDRLVWSGGLGVGLPTADDTVLRSGGTTILEIRNRTVHLLPFTGLLWKRDDRTFMQAYLQADVAANGDPISANLMGGPLEELGKFNDSTLLHSDVAINRVVYTNPCGRCLRQVIANGELHYTASLQDSDSVSSGSLTYSNLKDKFNIVNATIGAHLVLANNMVVTPGMSVPLRDGLDKQFDYEALLQLNYLR